MLIVSGLQVQLMAEERESDFWPQQMVIRGQENGHSQNDKRINKRIYSAQRKHTVGGNEMLVCLQPQELPTWVEGLPEGEWETLR